MTQNTYWAVLTLLNDKNTWEMDHFWWTSNGWTMYLMIEQFWTDYNVAKGISRFVAKMIIPPTHVGCIYHSWQQITWEIDHFWHPANEWALSLFQIVLEKQLRFIMPLREQMDQNKHINISGHPAVIADMVTLHVSY